MIEFGQNRAEAIAADRLILVAEDHPVNRLTLGLQLELLGYAMDAVADGAEALVALESGAYALLITDCHMAEVDGFELTRRIRAREGQGRHLPIIAMTASLGPEGEALCRAAGMDLCLAKPVDLDSLGAALSRWLPADAVSPSVDFGVVSELAGEEPGAVPELLADYRECLAVDLLSLAAANTAGDLTAISAIAHRIGGAARAVGAHRLARACTNCAARVDGPDTELRVAMDELLAAARAADEAAIG